MGRCQICDRLLVDNQCQNLSCPSRMPGNRAGAADPPGGKPLYPLTVPGQTTRASSTTHTVLGADTVVIDDDLEKVRRAWNTRIKANGQTTEIVTLCGFPTAGKSWTAERMLTMLGRESWHVTRDIESPKPDTRGLMTGTMVLGQTTDLLVHSIGRQDGTRPIDLIDVPGELFRSAVDQAGTDRSSLIPIPYSLIAAIALSDKVIFALPADAIVFGTLIAEELRSISNSRRRDRRAEEIELRDQQKLGLEREELQAKLEELESGSGNESQDRRALLERFAAVSRDLFEAQMYSKEVENRLFTQYMERVLGRAAFLVHRLGRDRLFATDPERWFDGFDAGAVRDLPRLNVYCMAVLTKCDRVLPLCTDKFGDLPFCEVWDSLPERVEFQQRLEAAGWISSLRPLLRDPRMLMARLSPDLVNNFDRWLQVTRYEWVSADWQGDGWTNIFNSSHDTAGIEQLVRWLTMPQRRPDPLDPMLRELERVRARAEGRKYQEHGAV